MRRAVTAKKQGKTARLKFVPKYENKTFNHFTPIKGTNQRANFGQQAELEIVAQAIESSGLKPAREKLRAEGKGLAEVKEYLGSLVLKENLVAAYFVNAAVKG